jgi:predicted Zn-dependent peptidase
MTVYKDAPRIQTAIAVRTGSKNDPADNTGLSHYLEHMMFKGTSHFGTTNFSDEKPYLVKIDSLFEVYRSLKDSSKRAFTYHLIDSISGIAAKYAIANEYDKLIAAIGGTNTNAFTWFEQTVYINEIPSNQLEAWLAIESDRFFYPSFRIFHTELETVYEEKNMSLDNDDDKLYDSLYTGLFLKHPYGLQTTIGKAEHLKNPSLKSLKEYYFSRYIPNNVAICLSGDFDPDEAIVLIDNKFGSWQPKPIIPFISPSEAPITKPIVKEVFGPEAESMAMGFRFGGANTSDADILTLVSMILTNYTAGLIDLNLNQAQKVLQAGSYASIQKDYSIHILYGVPKEGQKLEEVKDLILSQIELMKKGEFSDWLIPAIINDLKLEEIKNQESNMARTMGFVDAFINETPWESRVKEIDRLSKITKQQVVDFVNKNYGDNYVVVYKRTGTDSNVKKVIKPVITPVQMNRDNQSDFYKQILAMKPKNIEPVFVDYEKDIVKFKVKNDIPVYYKKNTENNTFSLYYVFDMGLNHDKEIKLAIDYLEYLGTSKYTPAQMKQEFYKAGCSFYVYAGNDQLWVSLSGLAENMERGTQLFEELLADPQPNDEALANLVNDILKQREDDKLSKTTILWKAMYSFGKYGKKSPFTNILSETELKALKADELIKKIKELTSFEHHILFYGPQEQPEITALINKYHKIPSKLKPIPVETKFQELDNTENKVYVVDYDMKQVEIVMISKSDKFNKANYPIINLFNEYFGGGMSSIVFQELRESRALAYSAYAGYNMASRLDKNNYLFSYIGTQNDKLPEALKGMMDLFNNMPQSELSFNASKDAIIQRIRTDRTTKTGILFSYESALKLKLDSDVNKDIYNVVPTLTFNDLKAFQEKYLKNKNFTILVLGNKKEMDIKALEKYGKVEYLNLTDIFGY